MSKEKKPSSPAQFRLDNVQFSWPFIFEKDDNDKHRVTILVDKKDKKAIKKCIEGVKYAYMEGVKDPKKWNGKKPKTWKNPLKDGDKPLESGEPNMPENKGKLYFTATSNRPVPIVGKNKKPLTSEDEFWPGCIGSVLVSFGAYSNKKIGVGAYLNGICKTDDGEHFGGGAKVDIDDAFGDLFEDDDSDDGDFMGDQNESDTSEEDDDDDFNPF